MHLKFQKCQAYRNLKIINKNLFFINKKFVNENKHPIKKHIISIIFSILFNSIHKIYEYFSSEIH